MDVHTKAQRHYNMSRIRGQDTKPEMLVRRGLHAEGLRFRLHVRDLPGRPDIIFPRHRAIIFVHGCFWHGHECPLFKIPKTRPDFWEKKIFANKERDQKVIAQLLGHRWRVLTVWECSLKGPNRHETSKLIAKCTDFVTGNTLQAEIEGSNLK